MIDVICAGGAIVDILLRPVDKNIFDADSYPLDSIGMTLGGDALNESTIISRLGKKVALMGLVGQDPAGTFIREACEKEGIDIQSLLCDSQINTSINIGLVADDGERTFVTNRNGSLWKTCIDHIDMSRFGEAKILSLASIFNSPLLDGKSLEIIFAKAKAENLIICADMIKPRLGETLDDIKGCLSFVDYIFPNFEEAKLLTGKSTAEDIADTFLACGVKYVVLKTGREGCFIKGPGVAESIPAIKGIKAIDTTGAGDNFASGFITALLDGKSIQECARFANATAAVSVQSLGATTGVQNREQVEELYKLYNS